MSNCVKKKKMKFLINTTRTSSGGNVVLRVLGNELKKRGHDVRIVDYFGYDDLHVKHSLPYLLVAELYHAFRDWVKQILCLLKIERFRNEKKTLFKNLKLKRKYFPYVSDDTIVVYSEGVYRNPFHAKNVVRWFLFHNRFPNNPEAYGKDDLVFSFREHFNDYNFNPTCRLLTLNYFNKALYRQYNFGERKGNCYIIRKGKNRADLPKSFDGPIIDDLPEKEKVEVFNRCKYCYDYDTQTFYSTIACVCGCIPIVVMEPGKTKSDYLGEGDLDYGRAYGDTPEQIEYAVRTRQDKIKTLDFTEQNEKAVDFFLLEIDKYFNK